MRRCSLLRAEPYASVGTEPNFAVLDEGIVGSDHGPLQRDGHAFRVDPALLEHHSVSREGQSSQRGSHLFGASILKYLTGIVNNPTHLDDLIAQALRLDGGPVGGRLSRCPNRSGRLSAYRTAEHRDEHGDVDCSHRFAPLTFHECIEAWGPFVKGINTNHSSAKGC